MGTKTIKVLIIGKICLFGSNFFNWPFQALKTQLSHSTHLRVNKRVKFSCKTQIVIYVTAAGTHFDHLANPLITCIFHSWKMSSCSPFPFLAPVQLCSSHFVLVLDIPSTASTCDHNSGSAFELIPVFIQCLIISYSLRPSLMQSSFNTVHRHFSSAAFGSLPFCPLFICEC